MENVLPQDVDGEQAVIGALLAYPKRTSEIVPMVQAGWFYRPLHREIWSCAEELNRNGELALRVSLTKALVRLGKPEADAKVYLGQCYEARATDLAIKAHVDTIHKHHMLRLIHDEANRIAAMAMDQDTDPTTVLGMMGKAHEIAQKQVAGTLPAISLQQQVDEWMNRLCDRVDRGDRLEGWRTGIGSLDDLTGGILPGKLWVVQAETSGGKSSLMIQMAYRLAADGIKVSIDSHEMCETDIISRIVAQETGINLTKLTFGTPDTEELRRAVKFGQSLTALSSKLTIQKQTSDSVSDVLRAAAGIEGLQVLFVDYIQLLTTGRVDRRVDVDNIVRMLQTFANTTGVAVVTLAQINDDGTTRESRAIKHAADVVLHLMHNITATKDADGFETYVDDGMPTSKVMARITKHRNGPRGRFPLVFHKARTRFAMPAEFDA